MARIWPEVSFRFGVGVASGVVRLAPLASAHALVRGDFGISKALKKTVLIGDGAMGTPYYLSPEICTDSLYSFASDMWALGRRFWGARACGRQTHVASPLLPTFWLA